LATSFFQVPCFFVVTLGQGAYGGSSHINQIPMLIANPIYDVVFKLLMSDLDVAKGFISRILGRQITTLQFSSQEVPIKEMDHEGQTITLMRMDFSATVLDERGRATNVLIEIQKAKIPADIGRFRYYLGEQYKTRTDAKTPSGQSDPSHLPIFTIYILNFSLDKDLPPLIRIQRDYKNAATQESLGTEIHDEFIESLTHDSFIAQISKLPPKPVEVLERTFALFNQKLMRGENRHQLYLDDGTPLQDDELIAKMTRILHQAVAEPKIAKQMEHEDVLQQDLERSLRKMKVKIEELELENEAARSREQEERRQKEEEREQKEEERKQKEEERKQKEEERRQKEEERKQKEEERKQKEEAKKTIYDSYFKILEAGLSREQALTILGLQFPPEK